MDVGFRDYSDSCMALSTFELGNCSCGFLEHRGLTDSQYQQFCS